MANKEINPNDILTAGANFLPQSTDPEVLAMQKGLLALQFQELTEQREEKQGAKDARNNARIIIAKSQEAARKRQEQIQDVCPHKKPNGQPSIAGQRDHQHNYIFICAYCAKVFNQHTLPAHLRIPNEYVGGPET
jgi:hypothetical protein